MKVAVGAAAVSFALQAPPLHIKRNFYPEIEQQGAHIFTPLRVANESVHEAKLAFRLVPPLLVHFGHLSVAEYYAVQALLGVATLAGVAWLLHREGYTRTWAAAIAIGLAFTYMGAVWFLDTQPYFDAIAASALVLALCVVDPIVVFAAASVALWTDERAIPALGVVALFHLYRQRRAGAVAVGAAFVAYVVVRLYLGHHYGLATGKSDIGPGLFFHNWPGTVLPMLLALEGLWVVVAVAYGRAWRARRWVVVGAGALTAASAAVALMVNDLTRSTVYMLPGVVFAFVTLVDTREDERRRLVGLPLVACVLVPTAAAIVTSATLFKHVTIYLPLPLRLLA